MPLSWNEIRYNAIRFASDWAGETREEAEGKSFWDERVEFLFSLYEKLTVPLLPVSKPKRNRPINK